MTEDKLYSAIENAIIKWVIDGTKTAGSLTREIMLILKQQDIYWRTDKPPKVGQYIINIGDNGISWGWWDGNNWRKLWHEYQIDVFGWLPTPLHKQQDNGMESNN